LPDPADPPGARVPWVGEHPAEVLRAELGLGEQELARLADAGVISPVDGVPGRPRDPADEVAP
ncbi:MAG TPA: hypothetical protein PKA98_23705, partial [Acidimicrobiales bacterium]|nr:hypothetical protein [Acidimicrobiales bacterium]